LEITRKDVIPKADALAIRLREICKDIFRARITRSVRRIDLQISGFEDSVERELIAQSFAELNDDVTPDDIRVVEVRANGRIGTVWVQAPAAVAAGWSYSRAGHSGASGA